MPKFKKNPSPIMKKGPYKMKYKHSAFPFKASPMKVGEPWIMPRGSFKPADSTQAWRHLIEDRLDALDKKGTYEWDQATQSHVPTSLELPNPGDPPAGMARKV